MRRYGTIVTAAKLLPKVQLQAQLLRSCDGFRYAMHQGAHAHLQSGIASRTQNVAMVHTQTQTQTPARLDFSDHTLAQQSWSPCYRPHIYRGHPGFWSRPAFSHRRCCKPCN